MSEKKPKPPRPPAPNLSKNKKAKRPLLSSTSISFRNSPLSADSNGGLSDDDDDQRLSIFTDNSGSKNGGFSVKLSKPVASSAPITTTTIPKPVTTNTTSKEAKSASDEHSPKSDQSGSDLSSNKPGVTSKELEDLLDSFGENKPVSKPRTHVKKKTPPTVTVVDRQTPPLERRTLPSVVDSTPSSLSSSRSPSFDDKSFLSERTRSLGSLNDVVKSKEEPELTVNNKPVEKVLHVRQTPPRTTPISASSASPAGSKVFSEKEKTAIKHQQPYPIRSQMKSTRSMTGLVTIANEVLHEEEGMPELPKDSMTDPLSFLDKFMDDDDDLAFAPAASIKSSKNNKKKSLTDQKRTKSLDISDKNNSTSTPLPSEPVMPEPLNIEQFYYSIPTPSEVKDVPVKPKAADTSSLGRSPPEMSLSLSGLLASHQDESGGTTKEQKVRNRFESPLASTPDLTLPEADSDRELSDLVGDIYSPSTPKSPVSADEGELDESPTELKTLDLQYSPPGFALAATTLVIFAILMLPLPGYMTGFFVGMVVAFYSIFFVVWLSVPQMEKEYRELEDPNTLPPLQIPGPRMTASRVRMKEQGKMIHKVCEITFFLK